MFGDLIPLPIDSNCPQFTSPKVGQEQGATTRDASGFARAQHYHAARQTDKSDTRRETDARTDV